MSDALATRVAEDSLSVHRRFAVAPMMELSDRHCRFLFRQLTQHALLYTEMLTSKALIHGDREYLLGHDPVEAPTVLQLGGSDPDEMAEAAAIGADWGYAEINMNVGCPSDRVQSGRFGACLMAEPAVVASCVAAMQQAVSIPVSVKCRLGIDRDDSYAALSQFVDAIAEAGCAHVIVHARKAWLDGLSPKENRTIPPLRPEYVHRLKRERPDLHITINGGIDNWADIHRHLSGHANAIDARRAPDTDTWTGVDGVMLGRHAYYHPAFLLDVDRQLFATEPDGTHLEPMCSPAAASGVLRADDRRIVAARRYARYMQTQLESGVRVSAMSRHLVALFQEVPGARQWRRHLSEQAPRCQNAERLVEDALELLLEASSRAASAAPQQHAG